MESLEQVREEQKPRPSLASTSDPRRRETKEIPLQEGSKSIPSQHCYLHARLIRTTLDLFHLIMPPDLQIPPGVPCSSQITNLKSILYPHFHQFLSTSPSSSPSNQPQILQFLYIILPIIASESFLHLGKRTVRRDEDLVVLRALLRLSELKGVELGSKIVLDAIIAFHHSQRTIEVILDNLSKAGSKFLKDLEKDVVAPTISALSKLSSPTSSSARIKPTHDESLANISRTIYLLLILSRSHPSLSKSILNTPSILTILDNSYNHLSLSTRQSHPSPTTLLVQTKSHILLLLHTLLSSLPQSEREWKLGNLDSDPPEFGGEDGSKVERRILVNTSMITDYEVFFSETSGERNGPMTGTRKGKGRMIVEEDVMDILRSLSGSSLSNSAIGSASGMGINRDRVERGGPPNTNQIQSTSKTVPAPSAPTSQELSSISSIHAIFPNLPSHLLLQALRHPRFSSSSSGSGSGSGEEGLINALLEGELPVELSDLGKVLRGEELDVGIGVEATGAQGGKILCGANRDGGDNDHGDVGGGSGGHGAADGKKKQVFKRDNIWDQAPMDFSKLRVGKDES